MANPIGGDNCFNRGRHVLGCRKKSLHPLLLRLRRNLCCRATSPQLQTFRISIWASGEPRDLTNHPQLPISVHTQCKYKRNYFSSPRIRGNKRPIHKTINKHTRLFYWDLIHTPNCKTNIKVRQGFIFDNSLILHRIHPCLVIFGFVASRLALAWTFRTYLPRHKLEQKYRI